MPGTLVEDLDARRQTESSDGIYYHREAVCPWEDRASLFPLKGVLMPSGYAGSTSAILVGIGEATDKERGQGYVRLLLTYLLPKWGREAVHGCTRYVRWFDKSVARPALGSAMPSGIGGDVAALVQTVHDIGATAIGSNSAGGIIVLYAKRETFTP